jgi:hypothetical protein
MSFQFELVQRSSGILKFDHRRFIRGADDAIGALAQRSRNMATRGMFLRILVLLAMLGL